MVSFVCDNCQDTVKKPKLDQHYNRCRAAFTCVDCSTMFSNYEWSSHTACMSEAQKVQGKLYRGPKQSAAAPPKAAPSKPVAESKPAESPIKPSQATESKKRARDESSKDSDAEAGPSDAKKPKLTEEHSKEATAEIEERFSHLKVKRTMKKTIKKSTGKTIAKAELVDAAVAALQESMKDDLRKLVEANLSHFSVDGEKVGLKKKK